MAGTDRQAIIDLVAPGLAEPGNGTLVGPAYADDYLDTSVAYDPAKAKQLLADAGYAERPQDQARRADRRPRAGHRHGLAGADEGASASTSPSSRCPLDVYYADKGTDNWYQAAFSIVDYGTRAVPNTYFQLALDQHGAVELLALEGPAVRHAQPSRSPLELDAAKRADLYKQAQQILQDQVPMMNFLVNTAVAGQTATIDGIALAPDWPQTLLRDAHYTSDARVQTAAAGADAGGDEGRGGRIAAPSPRHTCRRTLSSTAVQAYPAWPSVAPITSGPDGEARAKR